jgi:trk system potassium uptake protein TrkH
MADNPPESNRPARRQPPRRRRERVFAISRGLATRVEVPTRRPRSRLLSPHATLVLGFLAIMLIGALGLMLPFASASGEVTPLVDALFTSTSATGTVGLVVVDTGTHWSMFGQVVIVILMEVGGIGFMAGTILLFLALGRQLSIHQRQIFQESLVLRKVGGIPGVAKRFLLFTLAVEGIGTLLLYVQFRGDSAIGPDRAWWFAAFHAVSAYTGSGFDLMGGFQSFQSQALNPFVLLTMVAMIIPGDLGFLVVLDILRNWRFSLFTMETKLILWLNFILWPAAAIGFFFLESSNPNTLGGMPFLHRISNALFQGVTVRNAGFSTVDFAQVGSLTLMFFGIFMFIGAASASMGGGIKVNSLGALLAASRAGLLGRPHAEAFGRTIPADRVYVAVTLILLFFGWMIFSAPILFAMQIVDPDALKTLFDTQSALGNIGLSTGVPTNLEAPGKLFMSLLMFVGRLGPLTVALALLRRTRPTTRQFPDGDLKVG